MCINDNNYIMAMLCCMTDTSAWPATPGAHRLPPRTSSCGMSHGMGLHSSISSNFCCEVPHLNHVGASHKEKYCTGHQMQACIPSHVTTSGTKEQHQNV